MAGKWTRRALLGAGAGAVAAPLLAQEAPARHGRLILLGTKGGPTPSRFRAPASNLLIVDGAPVVIDCPDGVASRLVQAGIGLETLSEIYLTHHHSDHVAGLGALLSLAWGSGLQTRVNVYGPEPMARVLAAQLEANAVDMAVRIREEGRPPLTPLIRPHEVHRGTILETPRLRVRCATVEHYSVPTRAYRFDMPDRSIVFSGDTRPSEALIALARGADVLVHEAMLPEALGGIRDRNAPRLMEHLRRSHSTTEEVGRVAAAAGVRTLVLSHLVPALPSISDAQWTEGARRHFGGVIVVGRDMMEL